MALTQTTASDLKIFIAAPPQWTYYAGDTIIGSVNYCSHLTAADVIISLALRGFTKTSITRNNGTPNHTSRGVWELFEFVPQVLYRGPVQISQDNSEINRTFSIQIPETTSLSALQHHTQAESFIPFHAAYIAHHPVPGTYSAKWMGAELCIDFHLQAELKYKSHGSWIVQRAAAPITLGHRTIDPRTICFALQRQSISSRVDGHRLPSSQDERLSLKQKTRQMFSLSKKPDVFFTVDMDMPLHIQFDNPTPIPLVLRVVPQGNETSASTADVAQEVRINSMELSIMSRTEILCKSNGLGQYKIPKAENTFTQKLGLEKLFQELETPITTSGLKKQKINIGSMLQLVLRHDGLRSGNMRLSRSVGLRPSFVTFNIKLSHKIIWEVSLDIGGRRRKISSETGVTIHNSATRL